VNAHHAFPRAGLILAVLAAAGMAFAGIDWVAILAISGLWAASLFLDRADPADLPAPVPVRAPPPPDDQVERTIEPLGYPLLVIDGSRIELANAAARRALGQHIPGQDVRIALRHPDAMRLIGADDGAAVTIAGFVGARSVWQLTRRDIDGRRWMIELIDRTAEADVGRAHTDFVANASHELRTPLASVIGYVETLADDDGSVDAAASKRFLGIVLREARRMLTLVEDLMSLSVVEAEKHDRPRETIDLRRLARQVVTEMSSLRGKERVELQVEDIPFPIRGEPRQLDQLLRNLIDNALSFSPAGGVVRVSARRVPGKIVIVVDDEGPGISPDNFERIFDRFHTDRPDSFGEHSGLGLAISKQIVEAHRGTIHAENRVEEDSETGKTHILGARFVVELPTSPGA
jgi:two-component system phosphate regulon sensor histidine kinase PhoR